jgi:anaerobic selenocysteine-containing dehydrogenase
MTETCEYADVVLPAPTFLEKEDVSTSDCHSYTRLSKKCVEPLGESRSEVWVMQEMATKLGRNEPWLFDEPRKALAEALRDAFVDGSPEDMFMGRNLRLRERCRGKYQTPSGKLEFYSTLAREPITPLPRQLPLVDDDKFTLLNSALPQWTHSQFRDVYGEIPLTVWVNSVDAKRLGISDRDLVTISNSGGEIQVLASVGDGVKPGVLWSPRPLIDSMKRTQNALVPGSSQIIGGGPYYNSARVKIARASDKSMK